MKADVEGRLVEDAEERRWVDRASPASQARSSVFETKSERACTPSLSRGCLSSAHESKSSKKPPEIII
jgi:hypothetical protein